MSVCSGEEGKWLGKKPQTSVMAEEAQGEQSVTFFPSCCSSSMPAVECVFMSLVFVKLPIGELEVASGSLKRPGLTKRWLIGHIRL